MRNDCGLQSIECATENAISSDASAGVCRFKHGGRLPVYCPTSYLASTMAAFSCGRAFAVLAKQNRQHTLNIVICAMQVMNYASVFHFVMDVAHQVQREWENGPFGFSGDTPLVITTIAKHVHATVPTYKTFAACCTHSVLHGSVTYT